MELAGLTGDRVDSTKNVSSTEAVSIAGSDDLGEPTWGEGLAVLLDSLSGEAQLNDIGVEVVATES